MHIGIDARMYGTYHRGIGRYVERLIFYLAKIKDTNRYTIFVNKGFSKIEDFPSGKIKIINADIPWYGFGEHIKMPRLILKSKVDVMFWPNFNVPYYCPVPYAVTVHDLIMFHFPSSRATTLPTWKYNFKIACFKKILKNSISKAKCVFTVSEFSKRDIVKNFNTNPELIKVTYPGVDQMVFGTEKLENSPQFDNYLRDNFGINRSYLLYVGSAYPHKNLEALVKCFAILKSKYNRNWQLVLVGRKDFFYEKFSSFVKKEITEKVSRDIIFTGHLSDKDLDGVYRGAKIFVFPSLYEGFGLPPLEAMARGVPVVAGNTSSIPEALADSAIYFDPKKEEEMAKVLDTLGGSNRLQKELREAGFARVRHFTWEKTAKETIKFLELM
jgi:glycosyltransferase involved in cell wall biosynthesis